MKIISVTTTRFRYTTSVWRDLEGHPSVGKEHESQNTLLTIKSLNLLLTAVAYAISPLPN